MVNFGVAAHSVWMGRKPYKKERETHPGHYVREWREFRKLTQDQLAGRMPGKHDGETMDVSTLSKIENGQRGYRQPVLEAFGVALDCEPHELLKPPPNTRNELVEWATRWAARMAKQPPEQQERALRILKDVFPDEAA